MRLAPGENSHLQVLFFTIICKIIIFYTMSKNSLIFLICQPIDIIFGRHIAQEICNIRYITNPPYDALCVTTLPCKHSSTTLVMFATIPNCMVSVKNPHGVFTLCVCVVYSQSLFTLGLIEEYLSKCNVPGMEEMWTKNRNYFRTLFCVSVCRLRSSSNGCSTLTNNSTGCSTLTNNCDGYSTLTNQ